MLSTRRIREDGKKINTANSFAISPAQDRWGGNYQISGHKADEKYLPNGTKTGWEIIFKGVYGQPDGFGRSEVDPCGNSRGPRYNCEKFLYIRLGIWVGYGKVGLG